MKQIEKSIEVEKPVHSVYNQWTQFEEFPRFISGIKKVTQLDDQRLHWEAEIHGRNKEWDAIITDQIPDQRVALEREEGDYGAGVVDFEALGPNRTRVNLQLYYDPDGFIESAADAPGVLSDQVQTDLERFKEFIENQDQEVRGWRGSARAR